MWQGCGSTAAAAPDAAGRFSLLLSRQSWADELLAMGAFEAPAAVP